MVDFNRQYFASDQVNMIECSVSGDNGYPYKLTVILRNGTQYSVKYTDEKYRDREAAALSRRIENEQRDTMERIYTKLYCLEDTLNRIDKRQLRIWRQLKRLLDLQEDEEGVEDA